MLPDRTEEGSASKSLRPPVFNLRRTEGEDWGSPGHPALPATLSEAWGLPCLQIAPPPVLQSPNGGTFSRFLRLALKTISSGVR